MPGISELDQLSKSYGLACALLLLGIFGLVLAVVHLYRDNKALYARIEALLTERAKALDVVLTEAMSGKRNRA